MSPKRFHDLLRRIRICLYRTKLKSKIMVASQLDPDAQH